MLRLRKWSDRFLIGAGEFIALSLRVAVAALGAMVWLLVCDANACFRHAGIYFSLGLDGYGWTGIVLGCFFLPGPILLMFAAAFAKAKYTNLLVLVIVGYMLVGLGSDALLRAVAGRRLVIVEIPQAVPFPPHPGVDFPVWAQTGGGKTKLIFRRSNDPALDQARRERLEAKVAGTPSR